MSTQLNCITLIPWKSVELMWWNILWSIAKLEYVKLASVNVSPSDSPASLPASLFSVWLRIKSKRNMQ